MVPYTPLFYAGDIGLKFYIIIKGEPDVLTQRQNKELKHDLDTPKEEVILKFDT